MKYVLPLALLLSGMASQSYSQTPSARAIFESKARPMMLSGQIDNSASANKITAIKYRLSKQEEFNDYGTGNTLTDSARFIYSGSRGSTYNHSQSSYISIYNLAFGPSTDFLDIPPNPNSNDSFLLPLVGFDSLAHYHITSGTSMYAHGEKRSYNTDGSVNTATVLSYASGGSVSSGVRQVVAYNAGRMTRVYSLVLNGSTYDTLYIRVLGYNVSGNAILDSTARKSGGVFQPTTRTMYTYNAAGARLTSTKQTYMLATSSFVSEDRYTYTYLPSGLVKTVAHDQAPSPGSPLLLAQTDSFGYTPGVPGYTSNYSRGYSSTGTPGPLMGTITNHFASNGLKDSLTYTDIASGTGIFGFKLRYNSRDDIDSVWCYDLQVSPAVEVFGVKYFYESYEENLGVGMGSSRAAAVSVFPNPTASQLSLSIPSLKSGTPVSVRITNTAGQTVHAEAFTMQGASQRLILPSELAPGTYYLSVFDRQGRPIGVQAFLKL